MGCDCNNPKPLQRVPTVIGDYIPHLFKQISRMENKKFKIIYRGEEIEEYREDITIAFVSYCSLNIDEVKDIFRGCGVKSVYIEDKKVCCKCIRFVSKTLKRVMRYCKHDYLYLYTSTER
jgi:hypothetical protein